MAEETTSTIDISTELENILVAVYGEQVRGSIYYAIKKIADACNAWLDHQAGSIDTIALKDGAVTTAKLSKVEGSEAVTRATIQNYAISKLKLAPNIGLHKNSNDILVFGGSQLGGTEI